MANNASARKRIRQIEKATQRNRTARSRLRTFRKNVLEAIEAGDAEKTQAAYNQYASAADRAAKKNIIHKNAASRLKARMAARMTTKSA